MPIGIFYINPCLVRKLPKAAQLEKLINKYFKTVNLETNTTSKTNVSDKNKTNAKASVDAAKIQTAIKPDPPTLTGLALFLGFTSLEEFEQHEQKKYFGRHLKHARLLILAAYEKKLHNAYTSGPIFALKCLGWQPDRDGDKREGNILKTLGVLISHSGPQLAASEKEVVLK